MADEPVLTATKHPVTPAMGAYPLATMPGLRLLQHLISADVAWSGCTKPQRRLLAELCPSVAEVLLRDGAVHAEQMPPLPAGTRIQMRDALARRGLVDDFGRLTGKAVHAWYYAVEFKRRRAEAESAAAASPGVQR